MERYRFDCDEGRMIDTLSCPGAGSAISVARKGAELVSYRILDPACGEPAGLLYRDGDISPPASGWKNHATVLFPVVGRLKNGESRCGDKIIRFERNHGFARDSLFGLARHGIEGFKAFLTYSIRSSGETKRLYPFDFVFDVTYELNGRDLSVTFCVENTSDREALFFSCGWHPGFGVTGSRFSLSFEDDDFVRLPVSEAGLLTGEEEPIGRKELEAAARGGLNRALIVRVPGRDKRRVVLNDEERRVRIGLRFEDFEYLGLWREGDSPFICVEPWQGTDDCEAQTPFDEKPGIVRLPPGRRRSFRAGVRPRNI